MKQYRLSAFILILIACTQLINCKVSRKPLKSDKPLIGFLMDSLIEERWARDRDIFISSVKTYGGSVIVQIGEESAKTQEAQLQYLIDQGVNSLVLIPNDPDLLTRAVQEAKKRGVPVLLYERLVHNGGADLYLAYDAKRIGALQAEAIVKKIQHGSVVILNGKRNDTIAAAIHEGIFEILNPVIMRGTIQVVEDHWATSGNSEETAEVISTLLDNNVRIDAILAYNDLYAEAAIRVITLKRLAGKIAVVGADADLAACQRIAEGTQTMTAYKPIETIAAKAAELAIYMARKERVTVHNAIYDGSYRVPYYQLEPIAVDASNLRETVIKDGFHLEEEVYRNARLK
uniref:D-xylose transporter subunit XylF n=1 Tax=Gracilinema caldarium TaxID=215591 RepID=A0A7C3EDD9_9SPIR